MHSRRYRSAILFVNLRIRPHLRPHRLIRSEKFSLCGQLRSICIRRWYCRHRLWVVFPPSEPIKGSGGSNDQGRDSQRHSDPDADFRPLTEATAPASLWSRCRCRYGRGGRYCGFWIGADVRARARSRWVARVLTALASLWSRCSCRCGRGGRCCRFWACASLRTRARGRWVARVLAPGHGLRRAFDCDVEGPAHGEGRPPTDSWLAGHFKAAVEGFERIVEREKETTGCRRRFVVHYQVCVRTRVVWARRRWILSYVRLVLGSQNCRW